jgi:hypothetical protein
MIGIIATPFTDGSYFSSRLALVFSYHGGRPGHLKSAHAARILGRNDICSWGTVGGEIDKTRHQCHIRQQKNPGEKLQGGWIRAKPAVRPRSVAQQ